MVLKIPATVIFVSAAQQPILPCSKISYYSVLDAKETDMRSYTYRKRRSSVWAPFKDSSLDDENEEGTLVTQQEQRKNIYSNNAINSLQVSSCSSSITDYCPIHVKMHFTV